MQKGTLRVKTGLAEMLKGGVIMDVTTAEQAKIAEEAGAVSVMALYKVPADIRAAGGVARTAPLEKIKEIMNAVSIPVMAKCRIGHYGEAKILEKMGVDYIDESEVLTLADSEYHLNKWEFKVPILNGCRNLGEALRRIEEGAAMLRTKGEPGTGDIKEAVDHTRIIRKDIAYIVGLYCVLDNLHYTGENKNPFISGIRLDNFIRLIGMKEMDKEYKARKLIGTYEELRKLFKESEGNLDMNGFEEILKADTEDLLKKYENKASLETDIKGLISNLRYEYGVSGELIEYIGKNRKLPVVNFAAGGVSTPADAALMMNLGVDGIFVGSGIFKSEKPEKLAKAIVEATTHFNNAEILEKVSYDLGEPMQGVSTESLSKSQKMQYKSS